MILLDRDHLGLADLEVDRNAYSRQVRASRPTSCSPMTRCRCAGCSSARRASEPQARTSRSSGKLDGEPVAVRDGRLLLAAFHPELTDDRRVHERFLELVREEQRVGA